MNKGKLGLLIFSMLVSYMINTYYLDNILKIFNIISIIILLLNRMLIASLIFITLEFIIIDKKQNKDIFIRKFSLIYIILLIGLLFGRKFILDINLTSRFNFNSFIPKWLNHLDNKLVLYYLCGNILIYIPVGVIFRHYQTFFTSLLSSYIFIILLETLQAITKLGFFDIDDIILNGLGSLIGIILIELYKKFLVKHM